MDLGRGDLAQQVILARVGLPLLRQRVVDLAETSACINGSDNKKTCYVHGFRYTAIRYLHLVAPLIFCFCFARTFIGAFQFRKTCALIASDLYRTPIV